MSTNTATITNFFNNASGGGAVLGALALPLIYIIVAGVGAADMIGKIGDNKQTITEKKQHLAELEKQVEELINETNSLDKQIEQSKTEAEKKALEQYVDYKQDKLLQEKAAEAEAKMLEQKFYQTEEGKKAYILENPGTIKGATASDRMRIARGGIIDWIQTDQPGYTINENIYTGTANPSIEVEKDETITDVINPTPGQPNEEENNNNQNQPIVTPGIPNIEDKTEENLETDLTTDDFMSYSEEWLKKYWEREDAIRKETQEREDNAWQREIADMKKAGINPNLVSLSANGAASGGGITNATQMDMSGITKAMEVDLKEMQQLLDQAFQGDENSKDRFMQTFTSFLSTLSMLIMFKKGG